MVLAVRQVLEAFAIAVLLVFLTSPQLLHLGQPGGSSFGFFHLF